MLDRAHLVEYDPLEDAKDKYEQQKQETEKILADQERLKKARPSLNN